MSSATPSSGTHVALLRGINVGRAKRVAMADLRALVAGLGYGDVRTLLNSGNVAFAASGVEPGEAAARIEAALAATLGVSAAVIVITAAELSVVIDENPLTADADNLSRLLVALTADPGDLVKLEPLRAQDWAAEALAVGSRAAYLWLPDGVIKSRLAPAVTGTLADTVTMRNWATTVKLQTLCQGGAGVRET
jgi:uncharacterized protein (DUF1697 family)